MITDFIEAMRASVPPDARIVYSQFRGDPEAELRGKWRARVLSDVSQLDARANIYLCVSAMRKNSRGEFRRRKENFAAGLLLMIDDVGAGPGSKFPLTILDPAPPTALIETSPGNHQAVYMFDGPVTEQEKFEALISAFIARQFLGRDTGMAGVNRVFRPPYGVNGKPKYNGWQCRSALFEPSRRYSVEQLAQAFNLDLIAAKSAVPRGATIDDAGSIRAFIAVRRMLKEFGMTKRADHDLGGWMEIKCPWTEEHTGAKDNGAAIKIPCAENQWQGAFKCHHGSCAEKHWRNLSDWMAEFQLSKLDEANEFQGEMPCKMKS